MYLAIDIGTSSIKVVEKNANGIAIRWGILERRGKPFHSSIQPLDADDAIRNIKILIEKMGSKTAFAVASIPAFLALTAVAGAADSAFIPATPGAFTMSANPIDAWRYFLAAIPDAVVKKYADIFYRAGLRLEKVELESAALARTLGVGPEAVLITDVGDRSTTFTVARSGQVIYIEQTDFAAASNAPSVILKKAEKIAADFQVKNKVSCELLAIVNGLIR